MAGFAGGDDPFGFDYDFGDDDPFCYDPFEDYGVAGDEGEEALIGGAFAQVDDDGDGAEYCVSGFSFLDGDGVGGGGDVHVGDGHAPLSSHDETLGRSFDSDGGIGQFYPHLVSALELVEDTSAEEEEAMISGNAGGGSEFGRGVVIEEAADDDDGGGIGLMLSGFTLDPQPVVGGFEGLVDAVEAVTSEDDMVEVGRVGGLMLSGFDDFVAPQAVVTRPFRMVVGGEDTDSDDADWNLVDVLAGRVGEEAAAARRLPASRAVVDGLPEVALTDEEASHGCAVCKDGVAAGQSVLRLPCKHYFHGDCIRPWLAIRNTCPVCRFELPTGDADHDSRRSGRTGMVSVPQQSAPAQSGGTGVGSGATVGAGDDATECSGENRPEQGTS